MKECRSVAEIPQGGEGMSKRSVDPAELRGRKEKMEIVCFLKSQILNPKSQILFRNDKNLTI